MATRDVEQEWLDAWTKAGMLPTAQQLKFRAQLQELAARARRPAVSGDDDGWEWPLKLANELDAIYTAVSERSEKVYEGLKTEAGKGVDALATGAAKVGFGLWPLAAAVVAVLYFYGNKKGRRA
jgi:hypothetical protein